MAAIDYCEQSCEVQRVLAAPGARAATAEPCKAFRSTSSSSTTPTTHLDLGDQHAVQIGVSGDRAVRRSVVSSTMGLRSLICRRVPLPEADGAEGGHRSTRWWPPWRRARRDVCSRPEAGGPRDQNGRLQTGMGVFGVGLASHSDKHRGEANGRVSAAPSKASMVVADKREGRCSLRRGPREHDSRPGQVGAHVTPRRRVVNVPR